MKKQSLTSRAVIVVVAGVHLSVLFAVIMLQGCGTPKPMPVEPPPAPVMPPPTVPEYIPPVQPMPVIPSAPVRPPVRPPVVAPRDAPVTDYVIQSGDSLSKIAARHGMTTRELAELNGIKDPNLIRIGQKIVIPGGTSPRKADAPPARKVPGGQEYEVKSGDVLSKIAVAHGVTTAQIMDANGLSSDVIRVGQKLVLPAGAVKKTADAAPKPEPKAEPKAPQVDPPAEPAMSIEPPPAIPAEPAMPVEPKDSPASVLKMESAAPESKVEAPPVASLSTPPPPAPKLTASREPIRYPVSSGETVESIAKAFLVSPEEVKALNNLTDPVTLKPGSTILIPIGN